MTTSDNHSEPELNTGGHTDQKNKGGRPKGGLGNTHHRLNIYVSDEEYKRFIPYQAHPGFDFYRNNTRPEISLQKRLNRSCPYYVIAGKPIMR